MVGFDLQRHVVLWFSSSVQSGENVMDWMTFASKALESLSWPATVVTLLLIFRKPISKFIADLKIRRIKHGETEIELEAGDEVIAARLESDLDKADSRVRTLVGVLIGGAHSYNWIRWNTNLGMKDSDFDSFIEKNNSIFARTTMVKRDSEGKRVFPGDPGIKLQPSYREQIIGV